MNDIKNLSRGTKINYLICLRTINEWKLANKYCLIKKNSGTDGLNSKFCEKVKKKIISMLHKHAQSEKEKQVK